MQWFNGLRIVPAVAKPLDATGKWAARWRMALSGSIVPRTTNLVQFPKFDRSSRNPMIQAISLVAILPQLRISYSLVNCESCFSM